MTLTPFVLSQRLIGLHELAGQADHPFIQWALSLTGWPLDSPDSTPWCGAFVAVGAFLCGLPLPRGAAAARAWLTVGVPVALEAATPGWDVVVLERGGDPHSGHVGWFAGLEGDVVHVLGGNQRDGVNVAPFARDRVIGVRRLGAVA